MEDKMAGFLGAIAFWPRCRQLMPRRNAMVRSRSSPVRLELRKLTRSEGGGVPAHPL